MGIYNNNEGKSDVIFRDYKCKEALYHLKRKGLPYSFDLNIYRGCSHNCQYCYARKSHKYLNSEKFENEIFVKTNIAEVLERELKNGRTGGRFILTGCNAPPRGIRLGSSSKASQILKRYRKWQ